MRPGHRRTLIFTWPAPKRSQCLGPDQSGSHGPFQLPGRSRWRRRGVNPWRNGNSSFTPIPKPETFITSGCIRRPGGGGIWLHSIFTSIPFTQTGPNGSQIVNGLNVPVNIPDYIQGHPGLAYVFAIALNPMEINRVVVTDVDHAPKLWRPHRHAGARRLVRDITVHCLE